MYNRRPTFRERIARFMYGRCGYDDLSRFLMIICLVLVIANLFLELIAVAVIEMALFIYTIWRMMSKNLVKRGRENSKFLSIKRKMAGNKKLRQSKRRYRKTHVFKKCPSCRNNLRLPRQKGKHTVNCPCCHTRFDIKIR